MRLTWGVGGVSLSKVGVYDKEGIVSPLHYYSDFDIDRFILMQFTGLHDKNGKEVYEGDILKWRDSDSVLEVSWGHVGWDLVSQIFKYPHQGWKDRPSCGEVNVIGYIKKSIVIGNIYENPELLK